MSEWQPMESAPKDGTHIIVGWWDSYDFWRVRRGVENVLVWHSSETWWDKKSERSKKGFWVWRFASENGELEPLELPINSIILWHPMPEAPATPAGFKLWPRDFSEAEKASELLQQEREAKKCRRLHRKWDREEKRSFLEAEALRAARSVAEKASP